MKKFIVLFSFFGVLIIPACHKTGSSPSASAAAYVTFVNATYNVGALDAGVNSVPYGSCQPLTALNTQHIAPINLYTSNDITMSPAGAAAPLIAYSADIVNSNAYSFFACGTTANPGYVFTTDDLTPDGNYAKVRFVNLSYLNMTDTCAINGTVLVQNLDYKTATQFMKIAPVSGAVVAFSNTLQYSATLTGQQFVSGKIYTIYIANDPLILGANNFVIKVIENNPTLIL